MILEGVIDRVIVCDIVTKLKCMVESRSTKTDPQNRKRV